MHLLPQMNVMLDFLWTLPVQLWGTWNKWTLQKFLSMVGFEPPTPHLLFASMSPQPLGYRDSWRNEIILLQYLFTLRSYKNSVPCAKRYSENENKIIAYLQFGDWYHLYTRWFTQKKKCIISYKSMTIYNIFFIYYCLYCLYHNLFLYIISL